MNQSRKLSSFEGLRGIAAFIVVVCHLRLTFFITSSEEIRNRLSFLPYLLSRPLQAVIEGLYNGQFAVWIFWIMSAFVLSLQFFLRAHQAPPMRAHDYLENAFLRRYPRLLLPVFASVVFAYVLHSNHLMRNIPLAHILGEPYASGWLASFYTFPASLSSAVKTTVWHSFFAYDGLSTYNGVLWTMEKEFYGSLFLFAFLGILGHRSSRFFVYPLMVLANHKMSLEWLNAFVAGIALCDLFVNCNKIPFFQKAWQLSFFRVARSSRFLAAVLWIAVLIGAGFQNYRNVSYLIFGVAAVGLTLSSTPTRHLLSSAVPLFLGRISFGLYLIHFPIICSFSGWAYLRLFVRLGHTGAALFSSTVTCILSIIGGYLLYVFADRPGIRFSRFLASLILNASQALQRSGTAVTACAPPPSPTAQAGSALARPADRS